MSHESQPVRLILGGDDWQHPRCPHGPSLLMERGARRWLGCSAYRSRRDCAFHLPWGEKLGQAREARVREDVRLLLSGKDHQAMYGAVRGALEERGVARVCQGCAGVAGEEEERCCEGAEVVVVTREAVASPSTVLRPKVTPATTAQLTLLLSPWTRGRPSTSSPPPPPPSSAPPWPAWG